MNFVQKSLSNTIIHSKDILHMKKIAFILLLLISVAQQIVLAESKNDYISVSQATNIIENISDHTFHEYKGFKNKFNIHDPLTACKMFYDFSGPCINQGATAQLDYVELNNNSHALSGTTIISTLFTPEKFKVYLPPGTININLRSYLQPNASSISSDTQTNVVAAARIGDLPQVSDEILSNPYNVAIDDSNGADETKNFAILLQEGHPTIFKKTVSDVFDIASSGSSSDLTEPLQEGQWLYVRILARDVQGIAKLQFNVKVNKEMYAQWYDSANFDTTGEPLAPGEQVSSSSTSTSSGSSTSASAGSSLDLPVNDSGSISIPEDSVSDSNSSNNGTSSSAVFGTGSGSSESASDNTTQTNASDSINTSSAPALPGLDNNPSSTSDENTGSTDTTNSSASIDNSDSRNTIGLDYISVSKATNIIENISDHTFHEYKNFRDKFNIHDPLTACKMFYDFSGPCINQGATAQLDYVELNNNSHTLSGTTIISTMFTPEKFKVYLPPGTINVNLRSYLQPNAGSLTSSSQTNVVAAARIGDVPQVSDDVLKNPFAVTIDDTNGADETKNFQIMLQEEHPTIFKKTVSDVFDIASSGSSSDLTEPLQEGQWLYVRILARDVEGIAKLQFNVKVNKEMYAQWYDSNPFDSTGTPVVHVLPGSNNENNSGDETNNTTTDIFKINSDGSSSQDMVIGLDTNTDTPQITSKNSSEYQFTADIYKQQKLLLTYYQKINDTSPFALSEQFDEEKNTIFQVGDTIKIDITATPPSDSQTGENSAANKDIIILSVKAADKDQPEWYNMYQVNNELQIKPLDPTDLKQYNDSQTEWQSTISLFEGVTIPDGLQGYELRIYRAIEEPLAADSNPNQHTLILNNAPVVFKIAQDQAN